MAKKKSTTRRQLSRTSGDLTKRDAMSAPKHMTRMTLGVLVSGWFEGE